MLDRGRAMNDCLVWIQSLALTTAKFPSVVRVRRWIRRGLVVIALDCRSESNRDNDDRGDADGGLAGDGEGGSLGSGRQHGSWMTNYLVVFGAIGRTRTLLARATLLESLRHSLTSIAYFIGHYYS